VVHDRQYASHRVPPITTPRGGFPFGEQVPGPAAGSKVVTDVGKGVRETFLVRGGGAVPSRVEACAVPGPLTASAGAGEPIGTALRTGTDLTRPSTWQRIRHHR
jgi:hypothetical protein